MLTSSVCQLYEHHNKLVYYELESTFIISPLHIRRSQLSILYTVILLFPITRYIEKYMYNIVKSHSLYIKHFISTIIIQQYGHLKQNLGIECE